MGIQLHLLLYQHLRIENQTHSSPFKLRKVQSPLLIHLAHRPEQVYRFPGFIEEAIRQQADMRGRLRLILLIMNTLPRIQRFRHVIPT